MLQIKKLRQVFKTSCCKLKHEKCARALKEGGVGIRIFIFLSGKLLHFFLGLCDYSDKFPQMFCSWCGRECPSTANFCPQCCQRLNLSQASNKAASSVDKEKLRNISIGISLRSIDNVIFSAMRMRKRHLLCTSSHHNAPYEKQQQLNKGSEPWNECPC